MNIKIANRALFILLMSIFALSNHVLAKGVDGLERVTQVLVTPPFLPKHEQVVTGPPKVVQIRMVIEEKEIEQGVFIHAFTFNGSVPGPMIVVHEGDYVELPLCTGWIDGSMACCAWDEWSYYGLTKRWLKG